MNACLYLCVFMCASMWIHICMQVWMGMCVCVYVWMNTRMHRCRRVSTYECGTVHVCIHACTYFCMHVHMYACLYIGPIWRFAIAPLTSTLISVEDKAWIVVKTIFTFSRLKFLPLFSIVWIMHLLWTSTQASLLLYILNHSYLSVYGDFLIFICCFFWLLFKSYLKLYLTSSLEHNMDQVNYCKYPTLLSDFSCRNYSIITRVRLPISYCVKCLQS